MIISLIQILFWKQTNKKRERGELYIAMKAQAHKKIILLVKDCHLAIPIFNKYKVTILDQ